MHELSICENIIAIATEALHRLPPPPPRVEAVTIEVGRLANAVPAILRQYFDLLTPGTALAGARLDVDEVPIRARCGDCGGAFEIAVLSFTCPACGSGLVELLSGRELRVVSLDTGGEAARAG